MSDIPESPKIQDLGGLFTIFRLRPLRVEFHWLVLCKQTLPVGHLVDRTEIITHRDLSFIVHNKCRHCHVGIVLHQNPYGKTDFHHFTCTVLDIRIPKMDKRQVTYRSYKNFNEVNNDHSCALLMSSITIFHVPCSLLENASI